MKLEKFKRNKKQKKIIIGSVVGLILIIGGITLYRTFALYEEKKEFNVLKGIVPNFIENDIELAIKVDGESTTEVPSKRNYYVDVNCDNGAQGEWNYENWNITISNLSTTKVKCMLNFKSPGTIMAYKNRTAFWQYKENITKIVFENRLSPYTNASFSFDVSIAQDKSVMSYLVPNENDTSTFTLYIQGNGGVKANPNSEYLFYRFTKLEIIEGLEYLDTSEVTNMHYMFSECEKIQTLDLGTFDTRKVTNFIGMFRFDYKLTNLNVSSFNTSKAIEMEMMFKSIAVSELDVSHFDTSNVTNMYQMFYGIKNAPKLDLSNFNTEKVQYMGGIFENSKFSSLDISNFSFNSILDPNTEGIWNPNIKMFISMPDNAKVYVKDLEAKNWIFNSRDAYGNTIYPSTWTTDNIIVKSS